MVPTASPSRASASLVGARRMVRPTVGGRKALFVNRTANRASRRQGRVTTTGGTAVIW